MKKFQSAILLLLLYIPYACYAQDQTGGIDELPSRAFSSIQHKTARLNDALTHQTQRYISRIARTEHRLYKKLYQADSNAAKSLFASTQAQYAALSDKIGNDTTKLSLSMHGDYQPYADSLQGMLGFLQARPELAGSDPAVQRSLSQLQGLSAKMKDADEVKAFIHQRKAQLSQYFREHTNLAGMLGRDYRAFNEQAYYYSQQVREYKEMLNDPDKLTKQALAVLNKLPAFQSFMKEHSQLAGLFGLPGNYADPATLAGLQTRSQVAGLIQQQISAAGVGGQAALQSSLQSAQSQLQGYKDKLSKLGNGGADIDMPDFSPNDQKTKTFWRRLEYGVNFQTSRNSAYFPTVADFGGSMGYKLNDKSIIGIGASYKLGLGNGIQHIAFSSQGAGLRSFVDIRIKGSFSASGGFELNHTRPFSDYQQLRNWDEWTKSGLVGVSKIVSMKSRVFKRTKLQLLWDFLSYQQVPKGQAVIFRVGYSIN